jgi:hypothetical protein
MRIIYRPQAEIIAALFGIPVEQAARVRCDGITPPFINFLNGGEVIVVAEEYRDRKDTIENAINLYKEKVSV